MTMNGRPCHSPTSKIVIVCGSRGEACGGERLTGEARPERLVAREPLGEHLDRDGAAEDLVLGLEDLAHAAVADAARVSVAGGKDVVFVCHRGLQRCFSFNLPQVSRAETMLLLEPS